MNKRIVTAGVTVGTAIGLIVGLSLASSSQASTSYQATRTLTVVERAVTDTVVDIGAHGDSRGDQLAFANPVFNAANAKRVGHDLGSCVRTDPGVSWECSWTLEVAGGSLVVEGPYLDAGDSWLAITGGTGKYDGASGSMKLHALNADGTLFRFSYHIIENR